MRVLAWPAFRKEAANPHAALLARELIKRRVPVIDWTPFGAFMRPGDIWHLHHPETVVFKRRAILAWLETLIFLILLALAKRRGTKMVWTIHDLGSNDQLHPPLEAFFWRSFIPSVDHFVCLSEDGKKQALQEFPQLRKVPCDVMPHGHYLGAYPNNKTPAEARRELGLDPNAKIVLHFGLIRPYKNAPHLVEIFRAAAIQHSVLVVAGRPFDGEISRQVMHAADGAQNVELHLDWVLPERVQDFFLACDLVALPYRKIMNSGALFLALSFGRPVLVPEMGSMREHFEFFGSPWIRLYDGDLSPRILSEAVDWACGTDRPPIDLTPLEWGTSAGSLKKIYDGLMKATDEAGQGQPSRRAMH
jgi:beta-1,4-mannosyltransferase